MAKRDLEKTKGVEAAVKTKKKWLINFEWWEYYQYHYHGYGYGFWSITNYLEGLVTIFCSML